MKSKAGNSKTARTYEQVIFMNSEERTTISPNKAVDVIFRKKNEELMEITQRN